MYERTHTGGVLSSERAGCPLQQGQIEFEVVYVAPELDSDDENVEYEDDNGHPYRLYLEELDPSSSAAASQGAASLQGSAPSGNRFFTTLRAEFQLAQA